MELSSLFFLLQPLWRTGCRVLKKLEIELPYDPAISLLGIHTEETRIERDTCTLTFISSLFIIARTWKQPRCPSADEWLRKLWYTYTMEYYSAIKKNIFESVLMRWMKLEPIIQSEVSQKEKHQYSILTHAAAKLLQSCPTLCDPMDCSLPGSSIHGIFQATVLEWVPLPSPILTHICGI